jgi:hypothetical protein
VLASYAIGAYSRGDGAPPAVAVIFVHSPREEVHVSFHTAPVGPSPPNKTISFDIASYATEKLARDDGSVDPVPLTFDHP